MGRLALILLLILPGIAGAGICTVFLLQDRDALRQAFSRWEALAVSGAEQRALHVAETYQSDHRLNCFAEGVGLLRCGIAAAIGIHGLCAARPTANGRGTGSS